MNEELDYAEMLEIPVETVTVRKREKRRKPFGREEDLSEQLVEQVNDRMEESDPAYAESTPIAREETPVKNKRQKLGRRILIGEFVAVLALCATIFLTNIFLTDSAINTFVRGLFEGEASAADTRTYSDFNLSSVVGDNAEAEIAVSETGVLTFTATCSVYPACAGTVESVNGDSETGYTVQLRHSDSFTSIVSGLDSIYLAEGDKAYANLPLGYSDGEGAVRVTFYEDGSLITGVKLGENGLAWA